MSDANRAKADVSISIQKRDSGLMKPPEVMRSPQVRIKEDAWWLLVDPVLIVSTISIAVMGMVLVYSATRGDAGEFGIPDGSFLRRQALFAAVGLVSGVLVSFLNPGFIKRFWYLSYGLTLAVLGIVTMVGLEVNGTRGWLAMGGFRVQPSEPAKVILIIGLALLLSPSRQGVIGLKQMLIGLGMAAAPIALVLSQPDLGTVLVYLVVTFVMIAVSGVDARWVVSLALLAMACIAVVFSSDILEDYQQARLTVFLLDSEEVTGAAAAYAYNAEQAQIAIGNGGLLGQGLFKGTQTRSQLVPAQQTDFIFTVVGEELGLRGAGILLGLYALMLLRIWRTAVLASSTFGRLVCAGVFSMFAFQMFQAVGMTMGMMPVTGIPMPLVSYGGSSMVTSMAALGLVAGVYRRRLLMNERSYF